MRQLIAAIAAISIGAALADPLLIRYAGFSLQWLLAAKSLTEPWTFITSLFIQQPMGGLSTAFLIHCAFRLYFLFVFTESLPLKKSLTLGAISNLLGCVVHLLIFESPVTGFSAPLLTFFTIWTLRNPYAIIHLFMMFPIQAKWLYLGVVGGWALVTPYDIPFIAVGVAVGYLYIHYPERHSKVVSLNKTRKKQEAIDCLLDKMSKRGLYFWEKWHLNLLTWK